MINNDTWKLIDETQVTNVKQVLANKVSADTFRVTLTIINEKDLEGRIPSGVYIWFEYEDGSISKWQYLGFSNTGTPVIRDYPVPEGMREKGYGIRSVYCVLSHKMRNKYSLDSYVRIKLRFEELVSENTQPDSEVLGTIAQELADIKSLLQK